MSVDENENKGGIATRIREMMGSRRDDEASGAEVIPFGIPADPDDPEKPVFSVDPEWPTIKGGWVNGKNACSDDPEVIRSQIMGVVGQMRATVTTHGDRQFLADLYEMLGERSLGLPDFPETPMRLDQLMNEEEPNSLQVMRCIEADPKLVGRVWQRARSARFPSSPSSLDMAVSRIGMVEVWRLSLESALDTMEIRPGIFKEMAGVVRIHGAIVGDVAAGLAGQRRGPTFLCGLLHDVGQLLILQVASQGSPERSTVQRVLDEIHTDISVLVTDVWNLAPEIIPAVAYHHNPNAVKAGPRDVVRLLCLADIAVDGELDRRAKKNSGFLRAMSKVTSSRALAGKAMLLAAQCIDRMEADGLAGA